MIELISVIVEENAIISTIGVDCVPLLFPKALTLAGTFL